MRILKTNLLLIIIGMLAISLQACKTKKLAVKPNPPVEAPQAEAPVKEKEPAPVEEKKEDPAPVEKPDYNFSNVLFEFNSSVLKTDSYQILDKIATEMKKDPAVKFIINGHSSAEGTAEHNMSLSVDRANAVKSYLVNAGISGDNLSIKGYGATQPATSNDTESGRELNRRVEFKIN